MKLEERMLRRGDLWAHRQNLGRRRVSEQGRLEELGVIFVEFVLIGRCAWSKGEFDRREVYYVFAEVPGFDIIISAVLTQVAAVVIIRRVAQISTRVCSS